MKLLLPGGMIVGSAGAATDTGFALAFGAVACFFGLFYLVLDPRFEQLFPSLVIRRGWTVALGAGMFWMGWELTDIAVAGPDGRFSVPAMIGFIVSMSGMSVAAIGHIRHRRGLD